MQQDGGYLAKMVRDSISPQDVRLSSMEVTYPRFIHAEIMTHRDRARNAASSRAIPWKKMKENIAMNPVIPIAWGREQSGMVAGAVLPKHLSDLAEVLWLQLRDINIRYADAIHNIGHTYDGVKNLRAGFEEFQNSKTHNATLVDLDPADLEARIHKSIPNRLTEPWMWITVIMTATDWKNLFRLRCHKDAEVHFQKIAGMMRAELEESTPILIPDGEWHLPYIEQEDREQAAKYYQENEQFCLDAEVNAEEILKRCSVARCARISYLTHDGIRNIEKDLGLFDKLCEGSGFGHWSPHEHVATPAERDVRSGPFRGWTQYRKLFENECAKETA